MASAPATIPFRIDHEDKGAITVTNEINLALKRAARIITKTRLKDRIHSNVVLQKAGLCSLNEMVAAASATMVWKSKTLMDPLGSLLFPIKTASPTKNMVLRSDLCPNAKQPVPGYGNLAANLLARAYNEVPNFHNVTTLGAAKTAAKNWAKSLQFNF